MGQVEICIYFFNFTFVPNAFAKDYSIEVNGGEIREYAMLLVSHLISESKNPKNNISVNREKVSFLFVIIPRKKKTFLLTIYISK